ncbi:two-component system response regulator RppA [Pseudanabaena sp. FACHB-2040]|uniref:two-component system response regulator RppA n=1 Tax=Pseudanabaena sp. FACHB-2040 TaxID=2692859 RepID=UPI0016850C02|nr:two-component system response regulator RppA [Pseudanabaena sp. FACHB-2040]MBD2259395.1 response regulator transcription factor [Pseudanabaena sp. FACHB-2040]
MRILLVEDEIDLGEAIRRALLREKYVVDWVQDGGSALQILENSDFPYTLGIFDWLLPELSGLELCQRLRSQSNPLPVLLLTAKDRLEDRVAGLDAGADDYLIKPFGMEELLARLRALQRRSPAFQPTRLRVGRLVLDYGTSTVTVVDTASLQPVSLTAKEFQLLECFMQHPNQILPREQLMNRVWSIEADPMSNVVAAQIRLLRKKLADYGCEALIETVYGMGYRFNA